MAALNTSAAHVSSSSGIAGHHGPGAARRPTARAHPGAGCAAAPGPRSRRWSPSGPGVRDGRRGQRAGRRDRPASHGQTEAVMTGPRRTLLDLAHAGQRPALQVAADLGVHVGGDADVSCDRGWRSPLQAERLRSSSSVAAVWRLTWKSAHVRRAATRTPAVAAAVLDTGGAASRSLQSSRVRWGGTAGRLLGDPEHGAHRGR